MGETSKEETKKGEEQAKADTKVKAKSDAKGNEVKESTSPSTEAKGKGKEEEKQETNEETGDGKAVETKTIAKVAANEDEDKDKDTSKAKEQTEVTSEATKNEESSEAEKKDSEKADGEMEKKESDDGVPPVLKLQMKFGKFANCSLVKCSNAYEAFLKSGLLAKSLKSPEDIVKALENWADRTLQLSSIPMFNSTKHPQKAEDVADDITLFHLVPLCFQLRLAEFSGKVDKPANGSQLDCEDIKMSDCEQFKASVSAGGYKALNNEIPLHRTVYVYRGPTSLYLLKDVEDPGGYSLLRLFRDCQLNMLVHENASIKVVGYSLTKVAKESIKKEVKRMRNNVARRKRRASAEYAAKERARDNRTRKGRRNDTTYRKQEIARDNARRKLRRMDPTYRLREAARDNAKRQKRRLDPEYRKREVARDNARRKLKRLIDPPPEQPREDSGARLVPEDEDVTQTGAESKSLEKSKGEPESKEADKAAFIEKSNVDLKKDESDLTDDKETLIASI